MHIRTDTRRSNALGTVLCAGSRKTTREMRLCALSYTIHITQHTRFLAPHESVCLYPAALSFEYMEHSDTRSIISTSAHLKR